MCSGLDTGYNLELMNADREHRRRRARDLALTLHHLMRDLVGLRDARGMNQEDVANLMGISQPAVAKLERYDSNPTLSTIRRYALAVDADLDIRVTPARTFTSQPMAVTIKTTAPPESDWDPAWHDEKASVLEGRWNPGLVNA